MITQSDPPRMYAVRLVSGGPRCAVKVWYGVPCDPDTQEPLDRSPRWQLLLNGTLVSPERLLMLVGDVGYVKGDEIEQAEYDYLISLRKHALDSDQSQPEANPTQAINLNKLRPIF